MQRMHAQLTDSQLYKLAQEYGLKAKQWLRKFEGLLPEIYRRRLYKRRGFASIHEFAAKLGGMSHKKVDKILRLSNNLENKPALKALLESGAASYSKIEKVAYIATVETERAWAKKVLTVPQPALELCVKAARENRSEVTLQSNFLPEKVSDKFSTISFKICPELEYELRLLKQKLEKERSEALGFAEVLQELVKVYKSANRKTEPQRIIQLCPQCIKEKCAFPHCEQPPEIFHHTRRNEERDVITWRIQEQPDFTAHKFKIDGKVNSYRREPVH